MTQLGIVTLENEMDLILAYKKSIRVAEVLGLTMATQTAFATAVSEVCREVIDKAYDGVAKLVAFADEGRFFIAANISCRVDADFERNNPGFDYARKLVPVLSTTYEEDKLIILLKLGIPRSAKIDKRKVDLVKLQLEKEGPISAYEEIKQKNAQLQNINQQHEIALISAESLDRQKNEFLSVASHELNSPLTILRSFTQIALRQDNGGDEKLTSRLKKIDQQSAKLVSLIQQLLDISKIEHGQINYNYTLTNANEQIDSWLENIEQLVPAHKLQISLGQDCTFNIDTLRIEQVLTNLVANAAKYSDAGSTITIASSVIDNAIVITVTDEGIGMSAETLDNIFNKFYRSEQVAKKYSGLGMGLYIASRIVVDHNGKIDVQSEEGKGSVFSLSLPIQN